MLDDPAERVWKAFVAQPVHGNAGDGLHVGRRPTLGLPVDAACKAGDCIVQGRLACRVDRLRLGFRDGLGPRCHALLGRCLLLQYLGLVYCRFRFLPWLCRDRLAPEQDGRKAYPYKSHGRTF